MIKEVFARVLAVSCFAAVAGVACAQALPGGARELKPVPAYAHRNAAQEMMQGIAKVGKRFVAVGDHGIVLLSDDGGKTFRQAKSVPISAMLNAVSFVDERHGWAVGHWGAILSTEDGGETWQLQRSDTTTDQPLFAVHFDDARNGVAVGLWSLVLTTSDGGAHWNPVSLPAPPDKGKADRNLLGIFSDTKGTWFVPAERGMILRSADRGATWTYLDTGYKGSFWTGLALSDGTLIAGGLRGTIYRSGDGGKSWTVAETGSRSSVTAMGLVEGKLVAVGLDGTVLQSRDQGRTFRVTQLEDRPSLSGIADAGNGSVVLLSERGIVPFKLP
ncbi:MAG TPA: YCF48-related protein [Rhodocyclaceae bacterium]|nr:YCF48-related protein [Rhodocyclaceae bacterium]